MKPPEVSCARLTVATAVLAAAGVALAYANLSVLLTAVPAAAILIVSIVRIGHIDRSPDSISLNNQGWFLIAALCCVPLFYFCYAKMRMPTPPPDDLSLYTGRPVVFTASVKAVQKLGIANVQMVLAADHMLFPARRALQGKTVLALHDLDIRRYLKSDPAVGQEVMVTAYVEAARKSEHPWEFDQRARLLRQSIFCVCRLLPDRDRENDLRMGDRPAPLSIVEDNRYKGPPSDNLFRTLEDTWLHLCEYCDTFATASRTRLVSAHRSFLGAGNGDLLSSMVLGDRAVNLDQQVVSQFRDVGLSHILAASGFNMTVVIATTLIIVRFFCPSVIVVNAICCLAILFYATLAGASASIIRAALMCALMLFARCFAASIYCPALLGLSFLITVTVDPFSILDVGLQLSYSATVGIIYGATTCADILRAGSLKRWRKWLGESVAVVSMAQASVIPIQLYYFWRIGLLFLPANLAVVPLVAPITVLGFCSSLLSLIDVRWAPFSWALSLIAHGIDSICALPLSLMLTAVSYLASVEGAKLNTGQPSLLSIAIYYASLSILLIVLRTRRFILPASIIFMCATAGLFWRPSPTRIIVGLFRDQLVVIDSDRKAIVLPLRVGMPPKALAGPEVRKFLSFEAASIDSDRYRVGTGVESDQITLFDRSHNWQIVVVAPDTLDKNRIDRSVPTASNPECICILHYRAEKKLKSAQSLVSEIAQLKSSWKPSAIIVAGDRFNKLPTWLEEWQMQKQQKPSLELVCCQGRTAAAFYPDKP